MCQTCEALEESNELLQDKVSQLQRSNRILRTAIRRLRKKGDKLFLALCDLHEDSK